jgi:hypothetical protein
MQYSLAMNRAWSCIGASAAAAIVVVTAGSALAGSGTTEPSGGSEPAAADGCAEITPLLDSATALTAALFNDDTATLESTLGSISEQAEAAVEAAPDEIAADAEAMAAAIEEVLAAMEGVDLSDPAAVVAALPESDDAAAQEAFEHLTAWAVTNCGYAPADPFAEALPDAPEPPDCEELDAAAAVEAAGIDVDVADLDGSGDFNLPGFWTKSCSYGNGAMSLSTLSFNAIEDAQQFYADNLDASAGVVLDVAVGSLPASSLVIQTGVETAAAGSSVPGSNEPTAPTPMVQVSVFEAPIPFSVSFTGEDVDPDAVVAAAEAVLAAQTEPAGAPETTVA